jgi:peroxiredoxin Q/BCP
MAEATIATGHPVPEFAGETTGGPFRLADHRGKTVVLYFYPKDSTPGCTTETREFGDAAPAFAKANAIIVGLSRDSLKSHHKFKDALGLPFELISDPDETICALFGVMKMKNMYGKQVRGIERSTFLIDPKGVLAAEWRGVKVPGHVAEVLAAAQAL